MVKIAITGAGPAGLLLAQHLIGRPGHEVHMFEKRPDPASIASNQDRTFPIGLQARGMNAIREVPGLEGAIGNFGKWIDSISLHQSKRPRKISRPPNFMIERNDLVRSMLQHLRGIQPCKTSSLSLHFGCGVDQVYLHNRSIVMDDGTYFIGIDHVVAADGARSVVRHCLAQDPDTDLQFDIKPVPDSYKSLFLELQSKDKEVELERTSMHGWRAGTHQIITVPVKEDYSSGVYIFPHGEDPFLQMTSAEEVLDYFEAKTPGLAKLVSPKEAAAFLMRPTARSWTVKCNRLTIGSRAVLLGDAAHAVSASLGQGCNSALQDVQILNRLLVEHKDDWKLALDAYNTERLEDVHAVHQLSDYSNPRTKFMRTEFFARLILKKLLPNFVTKRMRSLPMEIVYDETLTYSELLVKTRWWTDRVKRSMETNQ